MSGKCITYTHPVLIFPQASFDSPFWIQDIMLAKSLVWSSMAIAVWKTICSASSFCFPLTHFHLLSSFSPLILLYLHIKNKGFHITNLGSPILPKNKKALWSHTFPTLPAYSTHSDVKGDQELLVASSELNAFLFSISHTQSTESFPKVSTDLFTMAPHNWYCILFSKLPSTTQTIFLSLPPHMYISIYLTLCALLSLNYSWRDGKALPTFILHDSTHSQVISATSSNISMLSTFRSLSYTPFQTRIWAYF